MANIIKIKHIIKVMNTNANMKLIYHELCLHKNSLKFDIAIITHWFQFNSIKCEKIKTWAAFKVQFYTKTTNLKLYV